MTTILRKRSQSNKSKKASHQQIALQRIAKLFLLAFKYAREDKELADRYVTLAKSIALRFKVTFSLSQKMQFCKSCSSFLLPHFGSRIRIRNGKYIVRCNYCKSFRRFKFK